MRNIRLTLAYDGTDFLGWQIQPQGRTVQGVVMSALERMHKREVKVVAAGRTDTGVHADGQVINFASDIDSLDPGQFAVAINSYLPPDVRVVASRQADEGFHARYSARARHYRYVWTSSRTVGPTALRRVTWLKHRPNIQRLNRLTRPLLGAHDFSSFTPPSEPSESRVREVVGASFFPMGDRLVFQISANAFLWRMVRSLAGTLIELDKMAAPPIEVAERLKACDHAAAGPSAPAKGLCLHRVEYSDEKDGQCA